MQAWQIHSYNGLDELRLIKVRMPVLRSPTDVLVKVEAASVNPIDIAMTSIAFLIDTNYLYSKEHLNELS